MQTRASCCSVSQFSSSHSRSESMSAFTDHRWVGWRVQDSCALPECVSQVSQQASRLAGWAQQYPPASESSSGRRWGLTTHETERRTTICWQEGMQLQTKHKQGFFTASFLGSLEVSFLIERLSLLSLCQGRPYCPHLKPSFLICTAAFWLNLRCLFGSHCWKRWVCKAPRVPMILSKIKECYDIGYIIKLNDPNQLQSFPSLHLYFK